MRSDFYFWTYSVDYDFNLCRTLVNGVGCNSELPYASHDLPVCQINPLPFHLTDEILEATIYTPPKKVV